MLDKADIHICTVMPATIDTPFFRHAANYSGRAVQAMPPVYPPEQVAKTMVNCALKPQREVFVGNAGRFIGTFHSIFPALGEPVVTKQINVAHFKPESAPSTSGSVFEPMEEGSGVTDGWKGQEKANTRRSAAIATGAFVPALVAGVWFWTHRRSE